VEYGRVGEIVRRSDSELATALLPSEPAPAPVAGEVVWELRYSAAAVDPNWLSRVSRELDTDIALLSGLIETVGGDHAGRLTVRISAALSPAVIGDAFTAYGIHAQVASAAGELVAS